MDKTQRIDPNRTVMAGQADLGRTQAMPGGVPSGVPGAVSGRTVAMGAFDPLKTSAMAPPEPLKVELVAGRECTMANGPAREQFLLELSAGGGITGISPAAVGSRTPMNLCLVIDRSGSMEGPPLEYAKQACSYLVDMLTPQDSLSIVTFEEIVELLMPLQRVTNKQPIKDGIARIVPGNTTDLFGGVSMALQQLAMGEQPGRTTRMIVLSDGDPTTGVKDFSSLVGLAGDARQRGITTTFLGFGPDYNEELLAGMAKKGGGNYYFIPRPELIPEIFRTELEKLMTSAARGIRLELTLARWVALRSPQTLNEGSITIPMADIERGSTIQQVFDFDLPNHPLGHYRIAAGKLHYEDLVTGKNEVIDVDFVIEFTADPARYSVAVNPRVSSAYQVYSASKVVEKTVMGLKTGQITQMAAIADLQKTQALLRTEGRLAEAQEVTMALQALQTGNVNQAEKTLMGTALNLDQGKK